MKRPSEYKVMKQIIAQGCWDIACVICPFGVPYGSIPELMAQPCETFSNKCIDSIELKEKAQGWIDTHKRVRKPKEEVSE